jgi:hypothetical protein
MVRALCIGVLAGLALSMSACTVSGPRRQAEGPPPSPEKDERVRVVFFNGLEKQIREQPSDPQYAKVAQEKLAPAIDRAAVRPPAVECHLTACILKIAFPSKESFAKFVAAVVDENPPAWRGSFAVVRTEPAGDGLTAQILLGREPGAGLRKPDNK